MEEPTEQPRAALARLACTACGYDIGGVAAGVAGSACPECGAPVFGFEAAEARAHQMRGMTMVLWGLPATLLACLLGYVVYLLVRAGDGPLGPFSAQRAGIAMAIVPGMVTLAGLWLAAGPASGRTLSRWLKRIVVLVFVLVAVIGAHRLVAHHPGTILGGRMITTPTGPASMTVYSTLSTNWIRPYGLGALAGAAVVLASVWAAWLIRASAGVGLMARTRRATPTSLAAAGVVVIAFVIPPVVDWIGRTTIPALAGNSLRAPMPPGLPGARPPDPWYTEWVNPDSALFVAVIGYVLVMLLGLWIWMGMLRLRERMVRIAASEAPKPATDVHR